MNPQQLKADDVRMQDYRIEVLRQQADRASDPARKQQIQAALSAAIARKESITVQWHAH